jgi:hypothetical protein
MLNTTVHPLIVGTAGNLGIMAVEPITQANPNLTVILQIIVALATLFKLFHDYTIQKKEREDEN